MRLREEAARAEEFRRAEHVATLSGEPRYRACGYAAIEHFSDASGAEVPLLRMGKTLYAPLLREIDRPIAALLGTRRGEAFFFLGGVATDGAPGRRSGIGHARPERRPPMRRLS